MKVYPDTFEALMNFFKKLPGIGEKSAERMAFSTLNLTLEEIEDVNKLYRGEVSNLLQEVKALEEENIKLKRLLEK